MEVFNIAYMDDTTWIGNNKKNLEKQLTIADSFNRYNSIRVNASKSKLLVLNSKEPLDNKFIKYGKHESIIYPEKDGISVRFLGVWISNKFNKNKTLSRTVRGHFLRKNFFLVFCLGQLRGLPNNIRHSSRKKTKCSCEV